MRTVNVKAGDPITQDPATDRHATRRDFLGHILTAGAAAMSLRPGRLLGLEDAAHQAEFGKLPDAQVIRAYSPQMMPVNVVQRSILNDALSEGIKALTGQSRLEDAWHKLLKPDDIVLIKFNQSGAEALGTTQAVAAELVRSLEKAGWNPSQLMLLEATGAKPSLLRRTKSPDLRWQQKKVKFGTSGADSFVAALDQATAIINVPFVKTHHMTTVTGCLKNLSHGLIQHPSRFHSGGCNPAIAEIVSNPAIRDKLRLNIVNGIRCVMEGGPTANPEAIIACNTLMIGTDPVACDSMAFGLINEVRSLKGKPPLLAGASLPLHLRSATQLRIGQSDAERIRVTRIEV